MSIGGSSNGQGSGGATEHKPKTLGEAMNAAKEKRAKAAEADQAGATPMPQTDGETNKPLSAELSETLKEYIRVELDNRGLPSTREALKALIREIIAEKGKGVIREVEAEEEEAGMERGDDPPTQPHSPSTKND